MQLGTRAVLVGAAMVVMGGFTACSGGDDSSEEADIDLRSGPPTTEGEAAADDGAASSLTGSWEGTYQCAPGATGLTLTIDDRGAGELAANFAYHPTDETPGVATGRYSMEGTLTGGQLALTGNEWIEQGGDHAMVGLEAAVAARPDPEHLEGTVVGEGCSTFSVERVSTEPWYAGTFRGKYGCNQGMTGLTLTTEDAGNSAVDATYEFYAVPENPGVPSGSYRMEGTYDAGQLVLTGVEWIDQPEGYVMVDLRIWTDLGIDPLRLYGTLGVTGGGDSACSLFALDRVAS